MSSKMRLLFALTITVIALSLIANVAIFQAIAVTAQGSGKFVWRPGRAVTPLEPWNKAIDSLRSSLS